MSATFHRRFPHYDVLDKRNTPSWNEQTRAVIDRRLHQVPARRFFTASEWEVLVAVCDRLIPQPDRPQSPVPIAPFIDEKLFENRGDGYRYADCPPLREAWRQGIRAIDDEARTRWGRGFAQLPDDARDAVLRAVQQGAVRSALWQGLPPARFFGAMLLRETVGIYYAHPVAWSEIGFGGPASPRGYVRLAMDRRDGWEAIESDER